MTRFASLAVSGLILFAVLPVEAQGTSPRTTPSSVTLTGEQWGCLSTRLPNLLSSRSDKVRVPLSSCGVGPGVRGPGVSNPTASAGVSNPTASRLPSPRPAPPAGTLPEVISDGLTRSPLYLSKAQLDCIGSLIATLSVDADQVKTIDLAGCKIAD